MQPMDVSKIKILRQDRPAVHHRQADARQRHRPGHRAAHRRLRRGQGFGQDFAKRQTQWMTLVPTIYNADTLGIRPDLVGRPITPVGGHHGPRVQGQDLDPQHPVDRHHGCRHGHAKSMGKIKYADKGNMTKAEIDKTIDFLIEAKKDGQFRAFWKTFDESVNLMASGEVVIQSMWSPAVAAVRAKGIAVQLPAAQGRLSRLGRRAWPRQASSAGWSSTRPTNTSTGTCPAGSAPISTARAITRAVLDTAKEHMSRRRMGLLDRRQAGGGRHRQPRRQGDGKGRRGARRRLLL